jgi:hypothetical protein
MIRVVGAFLAGAVVGALVADQLDLSRESPDPRPMDRDYLPPDLAKEE